MCNLYTQKLGPKALMAASGAERSLVGNLQTGDVYPDYEAPIIRTNEDGVRELALARWGMPSSRKAIFDAATKRADKLRAKGKEVDFDELLRMEPDKGTTNVRNTSSRHWQPWLTPEHRCLVPFTAFSEPGRANGQYAPVWFKLDSDEEEPLGFFAGIHLRGWGGVRKIKTGWEEIDLFAFLTTDPIEPVKSVHPKAMPVVLNTANDQNLWMSGDWGEVAHLQAVEASKTQLVRFGREQFQSD